MTKKHKESVNGAPSEKETRHPEEEKIFDFDKSTAPETGESPTGTAEEMQLKVAELESSVSELKDKHIRLLAEFDNYKKRTMRERLELFNSASRDVLISLLPVLDDFERAKKSAEDPLTDETFSEGVKLVYNRLYTLMTNMGLKAMESTGEMFDPELHEAITEIPAPEPSLKGKVIDTIEKGYWLNDKIIRHAKVVVGN